MKLKSNLFKKIIMMASIGAFLTVIIVGSVCMAGDSTNQKVANEKNFYVSKKAKFLSMIDKLAKAASPHIEKIASQERKNQIINESRNRFEAFLPEIPYIGSDNKFIDLMVLSAYTLQLIDVCERNGFKERETGSIIYQSAKDYYSKVFSNPLFRFAMIYLKKTPNARKSSRYLTAKYPFDWAFEVIPGDGKTYDYGENYKECGIVKLYAKYHKQQYVKYLCLSDYALYEAIGGIQLIRTQTIGNGGTICDFRFKKDKPIPGWPPENLKEFHSEDAALLNDDRKKEVKGICGNTCSGCGRCLGQALVTMTDQITELTQAQITTF